MAAAGSAAELTCKSPRDSSSARGQTASMSRIIMRLATSLETFCSAPAADPHIVLSDDLHMGAVTAFYVYCRSGICITCAEGRGFSDTILRDCITT